MRKRLCNLASSSFQDFAAFLLIRRPSCYTLFPYTTLFRSNPSLAPRTENPETRTENPRTENPRTREPENPRTPEHEHRSEEHTSELQSRRDLVCRLLLEKKTTTLPERTTFQRQNYTFSTDA